MKANADDVPVGTKFKDMFGTYEVVGEPEWNADGEFYVQDVRNPDGTIVRNAVEALRHYTTH